VPPPAGCKEDRKELFDELPDSQNRRRETAPRRLKTPALAAAEDYAPPAAPLPLRLGRRGSWADMFNFLSFQKIVNKLLNPYYDYNYSKKSRQNQEENHK